MSTSGLQSHDLDVEALRPTLHVSSNDRNSRVTSITTPFYQPSTAAVLDAQDLPANLAYEYRLAFSGSRHGIYRLAGGYAGEEHARIPQAKVGPLPSRKQRSSKPYNTFIQPKFIYNESDLGELVKEHRLRDKEINSIALEKPAQTMAGIARSGNPSFYAGGNYVHEQEESGNYTYERSAIYTYEKYEPSASSEMGAESHEHAQNALFESTSVPHNEHYSDYSGSQVRYNSTNELPRRVEIVYAWVQPNFVGSGRSFGLKSEAQRKFPSREELEELISPSAREAPLKRAKAPSPEEPRRAKSKLERGLQEYNRSFRAHEEKQRDKELVKQSSQILAQSRRADECKQGDSVVNAWCKEEMRSGSRNTHANTRAAALLRANSQSASPGAIGVDVVGFISTSDIQYMQTLVESLREENARLKECRPDQLRRDVEQKEKAIQSMLAKGPSSQIRGEIVRISREIQHLKQQLGQE